MMDASFDEKTSLTGSLKTFDAFPKTNPTYLTRHETGGRITLLLLTLSLLLSISPLTTYYRGTTTHHFTVEKDIGHSLQINLDLIVGMRCSDVHVNIQDASGDRILAASVLREEETSWAVHRSRLEGKEQRRHELEERDEGDNVAESVQDILHLARGGKRFARTPRLKRGVQPDACRIFGSMELNKVQGDFHVTARGHGYMDFGQHMDHSAFNFSHLIPHLSFGPHYPSLHNPLDDHIATTPNHFQRFQYFLSLVPTLYSSGSRKVRTNQYALTSASDPVGERAIPGVFFKFDIEPILLLVRQEREEGLLEVCVRIVNVVSGVLVGGGWVYGIYGVAIEYLGRRGWGGSRGGAGGMLHGAQD